MEQNNKDAKAKEKTLYEKLGIPGKIKIGKYEYIFKNNFKNNTELFTYRCSKINSRITINIDKQNLEKILDKENTKQIEFKQKTDHKCDVINSLKKKNPENCDTINQYIDKAIKIILNNPLKSVFFHQEQLKENNIYLDAKKVQRLINEIRGNLYPKDDEVLRNIKLITIDIDIHIDKGRNIPFCLSHNKFINDEKNNRLEQCIIFSTSFQLNILSKANSIFMDGTFKCTPKKFYQLFNIIAYIDAEKFYTPIAYILISNKSHMIYKKIFNDFKFQINIKNINVDFKKLTIICEFEKSLIKAVKEEFPETKLNGCFFHFVKALWKKISSL